MDVAVPVGHIVLFGRPRLGMLDRVPDEIAGDPVFLLPGLAYPRRGMVRSSSVNGFPGRFPQGIVDAAVATLKGRGDALGHAGRDVPAGTRASISLAVSLLAAVRVEAVDQPLELLEIRSPVQTEHVCALAAPLPPEIVIGEVVSPVRLGVVRLCLPGVLDGGESTWQPRRGCQIIGAKCAQANW